INAGVAGASFSYTYDANKNKLTEGISAPMANYGFNSTAYDPADRLTAWNRTDGNLDQAWNLSLVGNWATFTENQVQQTRTHTAVHEIAAIDAAPLAHDAAGNLTRTAGDLFDRYTWDFDNRLLAADVDQDGTAECAYRYDALGRRVSKTVPDGEGSATTVFVGSIQALAYSPHAKQVVAEYAADAAPGSPASKFVYAEYIDEPVLMVRLDGPAETHYYYHQNSLYSVAALTDATGAVVERYAYSAYGRPLFFDAAANLLDPQASTIGNPYLFTGRRLDEETGLYYYRNRMFDAELGRFVSRDPIGYEAGDVNLYRYVYNRPITLVDPTGNVAGYIIVGLAGVFTACVVPQAEAAHNRYPDSGDKFKHCWTSCRISKVCGNFVAQVAGLGKEGIDSLKRLLRQNDPDGASDWADSLDDLIANQQCIGWEGYVFGLVGSWIGAACRQSCEDCCRTEVGYDN
ncbi:MAG: RHS repeat-associated core domain-containing protein, partial [Thermoguttaceae bacterium]|nr:RHS repeat-associated core domain-containing protein [Thermoguttaceae bacterium]